MFGRKISPLSTSPLDVSASAGSLVYEAVGALFFALALIVTVLAQALIYSHKLMTLHVLVKNCLSYTVKQPPCAGKSGLLAIRYFETVENEIFLERAQQQVGKFRFSTKSARRKMPTFTFKKKVIY